MEGLMIPYIFVIAVFVGLTAHWSANKYLATQKICPTQQGFTKIQPLMVIAASIVLSVLLFQKFGLTYDLFRFSLLLTLGIILTVIDLRVKLLPNKFTLPGIVLGLALSLLPWPPTVLQSFMGVLVGGGFLWVIGLFGNMIFKQDSFLGAGDIKLAAMIGAFIGPLVIVPLLLAFFLALPVVVVVVGMSSVRLKVGSTLPFGPFIILSTAIVIFFGDQMLKFYL